MARIINGKQAAISVTVTPENGYLAVEAANGAQMALTVDNLTPEIRMMAMLHGLKQKLVDAAAMSRNPETGREASVEDKVAAVHAVYERLLNGQWNATRGGGDGNGTGGLLFRALARLYPGKDIKAFLDGKTDKEKAAMRKNSRVAAMIEEIRAEQGTDTAEDDVFAGLEG